MWLCTHTHVDGVVAYVDMYTHVDGVVHFFLHQNEFVFGSWSQMSMCILDGNKVGKGSISGYERFRGIVSVIFKLCLKEKLIQTNLNFILSEYFY
jgi:hypothetical protein